MSSRDSSYRRFDSESARLTVLLLCIALSTPVWGAAPAHRVDLHGYIRTGLGFSKGGATQADFQAPGAPTRYRLGNEAHTNFEFAIDYRHDLANSDAPAGAFIQGIFMMDDIEPFSESGELGLDHTAQAYLKFGNYLAPGVDVWVGRRYYDRKLIGISRYHWLNPGQNSQAGIGVEGWRLGAEVLDAALFRMEDPNVTINNGMGTINGTLLDLRLRGLPGAAEGKLTLWGALAHRSRQESLTLEGKGGYGFGLWNDIPLEGGSNVTAILLRAGAAITQSPINPNPVREDLGYDLDRANSWEINNTYTSERDPAFAYQWVAVARRTDFGKRGVAGSIVSWYSVGIRPVYYLRDHLNLAFETGLDHVDDEVHDRSGNLGKVTLALQLARSRGLFTTPVLSLFVTHAEWSDAFKGLVGNSPGDAPYGSATSGWSVGAQVETIW